MTIETISNAIKNATDLDSLRDALLAADEHIRIRREGDYSSDDPDEWVPAEDEAFLGDYCDPSDLPVWGEAPLSTDGIASYDADRVMWMDGWEICYSAPGTRTATARLVDVPGGYALSDDALDYIDTRGPVYASIRAAYAAARDLDYSHIIPIRGNRRKL